MMSKFTKLLNAIGWVGVIVALLGGLFLVLQITAGFWTDYPPKLGIAAGMCGVLMLVITLTYTPAVGDPTGESHKMAAWKILTLVLGLAGALYAAKLTPIAPPSNAPATAPATAPAVLPMGTDAVTAPATTEMEVPAVTPSDEVVQPPVSMLGKVGAVSFAVAEGLLNFGCSGAQQAGWMAFGASTAMCIAQECKVADDVTLALQHGFTATMGVSMAACVASCAGRSGLALLTKDAAVQPKGLNEEKMVEVTFPKS